MCLFSIKIRNKYKYELMSLNKYELMSLMLDLLDYAHNKKISLYFKCETIW